LRTAAFASIFSVFALLSTAWASPGEVIDRIVAVVNGEIITLYEVDERARPLVSQTGGTDFEKSRLLDQARQRVIEAMIDDLLIKQEAQRLGVSVSDMEIQNQVRQLKDSNNLSEEQFASSLLLQGMTRADYEKMLRDDILKQKILGAMVRRKVVITEQEIREYYEAHQSEFSRGKKVRLKLIVLPRGLDADELHEQISSGRITFEEAARKYSIGPGSEQGGALGEVEWKDISDHWREVLDGIGSGEMSKPFAFDQNTVILQLDSKQPGERAELDEVRAEISERLYRPKLEERFKEYIQTLRKRAVLDIRL
jgi:peptidyl-prolyl cis-trans isomerase SurA